MVRLSNSAFGRPWALFGAAWAVLGGLGRPWAVMGGLLRSCIRTNFAKFEEICDILLPNMTRKGDFSRTRLDFRVSTGSILVLLRCSFVRVRRLARRRAEPHFDSIWASPNEVRRFRAQVQNRQKIVPDTLLAPVTQQLDRKRRFV